MSALAEIICTSMDDQGSSDDGVLAEEADLLVGNVELDGTASIGLDVSEVTYVPLLCVWCTVLAAGRLSCRGKDGRWISSSARRRGQQQLTLK